MLLAGRYPAPAPATVFVEIPPIEKRKEEYPVDRNERCYRCRFRCSACGPRLILLYPRDDNLPQLQRCPFCDFGTPTVTVGRLEPFGEVEWLAGDDWEAMCRWVDDHFGFTKIGRLAVLRKSRLFACQCCRFLWPALTHPDSRAAVEVAEKFAERAATKADLKSAFQKANAAAWSTGQNFNPAWAANNAAYESPYVDASASQLLDYVRSSEAERQRTEQLIVAWLRDIFGNPFRPVAISPAWLTPNVVALAQVAYEERSLPDGRLDPMRLAVLADALEDAGADASFIEHLRSPGPHVRGCCVVDLLLGRQ
jgi:hypothetical protein